MTERVIIHWKNKGGLLVCSPHILRMVREHFSMVNPSYPMRRRFPRVYVITPSGAFQVGLWGEIESYLAEMALPLDIVVTEEFAAQYSPDSFKGAPIQTIDNFEYRDFQTATIREFLDCGRGIALIATGGGKSLVIGGLCKSILAKTPSARILIIVPNISLLNQLYYSFVDEFGIPGITRWGDKKLPELDKGILISNSQILVQDIHHTLNIVQHYDVVIVDEVHTIGVKKNMISKVVHNIHTPHKYGLTGTLPDSMMGVWNVIGKIGTVLFERNSYELREQNTISGVSIKVIHCNYLNKPKFPRGDNPTDQYNAECEFIIDCAPRNNIIVTLANKLEGNTLIVVDRLRYMDVLDDLMRSSDKRVLIVRGDTPSDVRTAIQEQMDNEDNIVCIAMSRCFSTGISINNLHNAIFACMGKSGVKTVQTIGRTVRRHPNKEKALIFDISDDLQYSNTHMAQRLKIYKKQKINHSVRIINI